MYIAYVCDADSPHPRSPHTARICMQTPTRLECACVFACHVLYIRTQIRSQERMYLPVVLASGTSTHGYTLQARAQACDTMKRCTNMKYYTAVSAVCERSTCAHLREVCEQRGSVPAALARTPNRTYSHIMLSPYCSERSCIMLCFLSSRLFSKCNSLVHRFPSCYLVSELNTPLCAASA
jgi:hypothetical protein